MVSPRVRAVGSTVTLVVGALLVGDALHGSVVTGTFGVGSPAAVFRFLPGVVLIWVGYRLRVPPEEYASMPSGSPGGGGAEEDSGEFDPALSPVGDPDADEPDGPDDRDER